MCCFVLFYYYQLQFEKKKHLLRTQGELQVHNVRRDLTENQTLPSVLLG